MPVHTSVLRVVGPVATEKYELLTVIGEKSIPLPHCVAQVTGKWYQWGTSHSDSRPSSR